MKTTNEQLIEHARENVKALRMAAVQTAFKAARPAIEKDLKLAEIALSPLTASATRSNHSGWRMTQLPCSELMALKPNMTTTKCSTLRGTNP